MNVTFADDWNFEDIAQAMSVDHQWNAIAPGSPIFATDYVSQQLTDLVNRGIIPAGSTGQLFYTNHRDINGNKLPFDTANGLLSPSSQFHVEKPISSFSNLLTIRKLYGDHKIAFGNYFAYYTQDNQWFFPNILMDIRDNPRFVDLVFTTPTGEHWN